MAVLTGDNMAIEGSAVGGGLLFGTIMAALGLRKLVKNEVHTVLSPELTKLTSLQNELTEFKNTGLMTEKSHKIICGMNARYIEERMTSIDKSLDLQIEGVKEHIDSKFDELNRRLDRRRQDD